MLGGRFSSSSSALCFKPAGRQKSHRVTENQIQKGLLLMFIKFFPLNSHNPVEQNIKVEEKYSLFSLSILYMYMYLVLWLGWARDMALLRLC